jgi:putative endopeptidase
MTKNNFLLGLAITTSITFSYGQKKKEKTSIDTSYMNRAVSPKTNFFDYANGNWVKNNPVPKTESRWGSMNELDINNKKKLIEILESAKSQPKNTNEALIGNYYASFIDMETRNKLGIAPIQNDLTRIDQITNKEQFITLLADLHKRGVSALFSLGIGQDLKNINVNCVYLGQSGLGLPNKLYYTQENKKEILEKYKQYLVDLFKLAGLTESEATTNAQNSYQIEMRLANEMMSPAEARNPDNTYNKITSNELTQQLNNIHFESYLKSLGIPKVDYFIVGQINYISKIPTIFNELPLETWKSYLKSRLISYYSNKLTENFAKLNFNFYQTVLTGKSTDKPYSDKAVNELTNLPIGEVLGQLFVEKNFSNEAKVKINEMVDLLILAYKERITASTWMSDSTKNEAYKKLNAIHRKLGFPDKWEDFSKITLSPTSYLDNFNRCKIYEFDKSLADLTQPVDKTRWGVAAHMINAFYDASQNEIIFPAGIMQAPFFDVNAEDALNFSRIGMIIGHELTHGFDDVGAKFAADGSFADWWTESDKKKFEDKTKVYGETFALFCPFPEHCVNPELTMGENIADLGGILLAYQAYTKTEEFKSGKKRFGFTPEQRFFIAMAQVFKINYTEQELKNRLLNDPHSPGMYRVNGPLKNIPAFFDAFEVKEGDAMRNGNGKFVEIW